MADAKTINTRIVLRNDELSAWEKSEKQLLKGEVAFARLSGTNDFEMRIGTGDKTWNQLSDSNVVVPDSTKFYEVTLTSQVALADKVNALSDYNATAKNGDIGVVKELIADGKYSHTAYRWDKATNGWVALDGNYSADSVIFDNDLTYTVQVGALSAVASSGSSTLAAKGKSLEQVLGSILAKEKAGEKTADPNVTATITPTGNADIGQKITPAWNNIAFTDGSYTYGPTPGVTAKSWYIKNNKTNETSSTNAAGSFNEYQLTAESDAYTTTVSANYDAAPNYANSNIGNVGTYKIPAGTDTATGTITARSYYLSGYFPTKQYTPSALLSSDLITVGNTISAKTGFTKTFITGANQPADKTGLSLNTMQQLYIIAPHGKIKSLTVKQQTPPAPHTVKVGKIKLPTANSYSSVVYDVFYIDNDGAGGANKYDFDFSYGTYDGSYTFGADL